VELRSQLERKLFSRILIAFVVLGVVVALFLLGRMLACGLVTEASWCLWWPHFSLERVKHLVDSAGPWAMVVSIGLMVLHSFVPFPAEFIAITNGLAFGFAKGLLVTWVGAMAGAVLAFGLARSLGRPFVLRLLSDDQERRLEEWVSRLGTETLLISRVIPVISFNLINYAAGLSPVTWRTFIWTTGLGILPLTVLMVLAGEGIDTLPLWTWFLVLGAALGILAVFHAVNSYRKKRSG
jgi:uncharacterized membrane protein YdjX (TVP38/TMEM64 family)